MPSSWAFASSQSLLACMYSRFAISVCSINWNLLFDKVFYCQPKICINYRDFLTTSSKCINVVMIVEFQRFYCTACVVQPRFNGRGMIPYLIDMSFNVSIRHCKANKPYWLQILLTEFVTPIRRDVTALHYKVLPILYRCLHHFTDNRPKFFGEGIIIFWCESYLAASNKAHFQMVYRQIRILVFFKHPLGQ